MLKMRGNSTADMVWDPTTADCIGAPIWGYADIEAWTSSMLNAADTQTRLSSSLDEGAIWMSPFTADYSEGSFTADEDVLENSYFTDGDTEYMRALTVGTETDDTALTGPVAPTAAGTEFEPARTLYIVRKCGKLLSRDLSRVVMGSAHG